MTYFVDVGLPVQEAVILARVPRRHVTASRAHEERAVAAVRQTRQLHVTALQTHRHQQLVKQPDTSKTYIVS